VMALTATPRTDGAKPFELTDSERNGDIPAVRDRLFAEKGLKAHTVARNLVIDTITKLALRHKGTGQPILVFVRTVQAVAEVRDLTPLDSQAQRFGRVNRRGTGPTAEIDIVYEADPDPKKKDDRFEQARWATREVLANRELLPACAWNAERQDASPAALGRMM